MVLSAGFLFDTTTPFPSYAALLPCAGAVLIIACGSGSAATLLSSGPMRWIGEISYSLYLWHWPVLAIYRYFFTMEIAATSKLILIVLIFALSYFSWRFIEQPWRRGGFRRLVFGTTVIAAILFAVVASALPMIDRRFQRLPESVARMANGASDTNPRRKECDGPSLQKIGAGEVCTIGSAGVPVSFALVGDSIGDALMPGVDAAAREVGRRGLVFVKGGCSPLFDVNADGIECMNFFRAVNKELEARPDIRQIVFVGRWAAMVEGGRFGESSDTRFMRDSWTVQVSSMENLRVFERAMNRIAKKLPGRDVSIIIGVPEQAISVPRVLAMQALRGDTLSRGVSRSHNDQRNARLRRILSRAAKRHGYQVVDISRWACSASICPVLTPDGRPLYSDDNHPSRTAAVRWRGAFREALEHPSTKSTPLHQTAGAARTPAK